MNRYPQKKAQDSQKPFPGCIGRMINIFELSAGMNGSRLLTDKAHKDGSSVHMSKPDIKKSVDPCEDYVDNKQIVGKMKKCSSSKKSSGTPIKMLIAEEMSKETESKRKQPCLVARLMGLDGDLPAQQPILINKGGSLQEYYPSNALTSFGACQQQDASSKVNHEEMEVKDIFEVWQQPSRVNINKDQALQWGTCSNLNNENRIALVCKKFMEAKSLATDERLIQSKEFQDAIEVLSSSKDFEVLSSNKDFLIQFLEDPNRLFSKQIKDLHPILPAPHTKRITILKPSKEAEIKSEKLVRRQQYLVVDERRYKSKKHQWDSSLNAQGLSNPTRIVVLKPNTTKTFGMKATSIHSITPAKEVEHNNIHGDIELCEDIGSKHHDEIIQQIRETSSCHRRDESLLSSVYSNGYGGDESSFHRSEDDYIKEDGGSLSDSEIVTPTSRHSWDYARFGSPCSISSISRASYSPESSLLREAKKRLSERWALMTSNRINQEDLQLRRSSSTLGEMLAIPEIKKQERNDIFVTSSSKSCGGEDELSLPTSCLSIVWSKDTEEDGSPKSLSRSKSVPVSSSAYDDIGMKVEVSNSHGDKLTVSKKATESKKWKLSFKGKVSSFFFSRSKKPSGQKLVSPSFVDFDGKNHSVDAKSAELLKQVHKDLPVESPMNEESCIARDVSVSAVNMPKNTALSLDKPRACGSLNDKDKFSSYQTSNTNQDQPSPTSILDAPFEDEGNDNETPSSEATYARQQQPLSRASPIGSISRTLSWDDDFVDTSSAKPLKMVTLLPNDDEHENFLFVENVLSSAGFGQPNSVFSGWHTLDSPLDPLLFDKLLDHKEEGARCKEERARKRFLFDCVNLALLQLGYAVFHNAYSWSRPSSLVIQDDVWSIVKDWLSDKCRPVFGEADNSIQAAERALRIDIAGKEWVEWMRLEMEGISTEISGEVLQDLIGETVSDFTMAFL